VIVEHLASCERTDGQNTAQTDFVVGVMSQQ